MPKIDVRGTRVIDLSQPIAADIPVPPAFAPPELRTIASQVQGSVSNVEQLTLILHEGTHVDAPYHFFSDLPTVDELPPDCLIGPAVVVDLTDRRGDVAIEARDIKQWETAVGEAIRPGDTVLLHTGHSRHWQAGESGRAYWANGWPHLARSAVEYLAAKPIKAIGVETFDPDRVDLDDMASAEFLTHRTFLPRGILVIENLTCLDQIPAVRCQIIALPLKIAGASGSPVRVIAVV
jgi:arylformamidase